jgi:hypothetical protein
MIPYSQNDKFTRRESVSAQLTRFLSMSGHRRVALYGLGGAGYVTVLVLNTDSLADSCQKNPDRSRLRVSTSIQQQQVPYILGERWELGDVQPRLS